MKKRFFSFLLALTMICLSIAPANLVIAESRAIFSATIDNQSPTVNDEIKYTVSINYTGNITSGGFIIETSENLDCISITNLCTQLTAVSNPETNMIGYYSTTGINLDGNIIPLFEVTFSVLQEGPIKINLIVDELADENSEDLFALVDTSATEITTVTEGYVDPDLAALNELKAKIETIPDAMLTVSQADVPDQSAAETKIENLLQMYLMGQTDVTFDVVVDPFVPAIAGTKDAPEGTDGSYTAKVTLYKGTQSVDVTKSGTITATPYAHEHTYKFVAGKPATCTEDGVQAHYVCEECGKVFTAQDPDTGTTLDALVIKAGHKFENPGAHHEAVEATCNTDGSIEYYVCDVCGKKFATKDSTTELTNADIVIKAHHTLGELVPEVEATCTIEGSKAYYECTVCHKKFADAEGTQEIDNIVIPALSHSLKEHPEVPATCTETGTEAYWECTRDTCGKLFSDAEGNKEIVAPETIAALGHNMTHHEAVASTCKTHGTIEYWSCDRCNKNYTDETGNNVADSLEAPLAAHTLTKTDAKEPTTTVPGNIEYWTCSVCDKLFKDEAGTIETTEEEVTIPVHVHSMTQVEEKPATCTEAGTEAYWKCEICSKMFSDEQGQNEIPSPVEIPALGHNMTRHEAVASTCTTHGTIEYWSCDRCDKNYKDEEGNEVADSLEAPLAAHTLTSTEAKAPTATTDGNIAYWTCSVCNKKFSDEKGTTEVTDVTIPALGEQVEEIIEENVQLTTEAVTQDQAVAQIVAQVKEALKNDDYDVTVNVSSFVAPVAGTAEKPEGTAGQIVYMVTITNPENAEDTMTTTAQTLAIAAKEYVAPAAPTYTITVNGAYVDKNTAKEGETVTVTAPYRYGYTFIGWKTSANLTLANRSPVSFKMPAGNVTIEPVYTYNPIYYPPVDYDPPVISKPVTKPEKVEDGWHGDQYYQDGEPVVGWLEVTHGTWYSFDRSGSMVTGWEKVNGTWYYMLDSGVMATGWVKVDGSWYFLKSSGAMATGWLWDNGHWYYLSGSGAMKTGWVLSGSKWYYLNASGAMVTGWVEWKGDWYYMNTPNGDMAVDTKTPDGYYVNSDGIWVK